MSTQLGADPFPVLYGLASQTDIAQAWLWIKRMTTTGSLGNRFTEAAALTLFAEGDDVLERLSSVGTHFGRDQRTIRDWSDRGIPYVAQILNDASYLSGSRSQHFVDLAWTLGDANGDIPWRLQIFWAGHEFLRGEKIRVFVVDPALGPDEDDFTMAGQPLIEIDPDWQPMDRPTGAFSIQAACLVGIPHPRTFSFKALTFRFGRQATQLVRISGTPRLAGVTNRVSTFRQGVTFWFDDNHELPGSDFDWGSPVDINVRTEDADSASEGPA